MTMLGSVLDGRIGTATRTWLGAQAGQPYYKCSTTGEDLAVFAAHSQVFLSYKYRSDCSSAREATAVQIIVQFSKASVAIPKTRF